jgi:hypothetical protein
MGAHGADCGIFCKRAEVRSSLIKMDLIWRCDLVVLVRPLGDEGSWRLCTWAAGPVKEVWSFTEVSNP